MYIHHDAQLIYLAHPRTASVCTATALKKVGFKKMEPPSDHHSQLWDRGTPVTRETRDGWTVFTTVRNHWDAAVSWAFKRYYRHGMNPDPPWGPEAFDYALDWHANRWVKEDTLWHLHAPDADLIMRYENLDDDLASVLGDAGGDVPELVPHNVSREREGAHYAECMTDEGREYIGDRFAAEIERYGYEWDGGGLHRVRRRDGARRGAPVGGNRARRSRRSVRVPSGLRCLLP